ncbi:MAG: P1 family peptidase [Thermoanaerobaculia bacterium]
MSEAAGGLTAVPGIAVGHYQLEERPTGCTVVLTEAGAVAGVDVQGGAPGTRETALLDPVNTVAEVHAIVLSGGSAFGLDTACGVVRYLAERDVGYQTRAAKVPIVPAAILYDLSVGGRPDLRPGADAGYRAAAAASSGPVTEGNVGAGAGATIGKVAGMDRAMKSGLGTAAIDVGGLIVAALVAVNSVGDTIDPATGKVIAGVRTEDGSGLADARRLLRGGRVSPRGPNRATAGENTTLGIVATNARMSKAEITKVARVAHSGIARAVSPAHTVYDGDALFALATGTLDEPAEPFQVGALAAEMVADAIVRAARAATGLPGLPAAGDLRGLARHV